MAAGYLVAGEKPDGGELFERVWMAEDGRSHGGDGLGPVFNAKSCVACHNLGGPGGAGGFEENVKLLSVALPPLPVNVAQPAGAQPAAFQAPATEPAATPATKVEVSDQQRQEQRKQVREKLIAIHPEFRDSDTVVVHRHGTDRKAHEQWRARLAQLGLRTLVEVPNGQSDSIGPPMPVVGSTVTNFQIPQNVIRSNVRLSGSGFGGGFVSFPDPNTFPELTAIMGRVNVLKSQGHAGTSHAASFEGVAALRTSQRNTTALWGAGLIDRIPVEVIEALATAQREADRGISGRPHRLPDGRLGRFGWKGQKASLHDFTLAACANELGLNVPGETQANVAYDPEYRATGLDLNDAEVDALVDYIAALPAPRRMSPAEPIASRLAEGHELFGSIGCAGCHVEDVGEVRGLFSDLLLHDLGSDLGSVGSYGVPSVPEPDPQDLEVASAEGEAKPKPAPPTSREWRTPPLWGVGSSAPYLHDGRAKTLEQAIAFHGGEAAKSRLRFLLLEDDEREAVIAFLESLVAPEMVASRN